MFWSVFSLQVGHCVYWVYIIILMNIIIVVYDYYYLSSLLAEDWHFEICLSLDAVAEKNKLLLLILFQKSLDSEIFCPHFLFPPYSVSVYSSLKWTLDLFSLFLFCYFWGFFFGGRVWGRMPGKCFWFGGFESGLLHSLVVTSLCCIGPVWQR